MSGTDLIYALPLRNLYVIDVNGNYYFHEQWVTTAKAVFDDAVGKRT